MRKVEIILLVLTALSFAWLFIHWDGGSLLVTLSLFTLAFFYLLASSVVMGGLHFKKGVQAPAWWLGMLVVSGLAISTLLIGGMFRILMWEGGYTMMMLGLVILGLMVLIGLLVRLFRKPGATATGNETLDHGMTPKMQNIPYRPFFVRGIGGLVVGVTLLLTPQTFWVYHTHYNVPEYRDALIDWTEDPENEEKRKRVDEYWDEH